MHGRPELAAILVQEWELGFLEIAAAADHALRAWLERELVEAEQFPPVGLNLVRVVSEQVDERIVKAHDSLGVLMIGIKLGDREADRRLCEPAVQDVIPGGKWAAFVNRVAHRYLPASSRREWGACKRR
ncbi:MAG: hypothetical protein NTX95_01630 [Actinobacteria bacterium]|nr:hypothetical protein [Actinomycetota bacterium]